MDTLMTHSSFYHDKNNGLSFRTAGLSVSPSATNVYTKNSAYVKLTKGFRTEAFCVSAMWYRYRLVMYCSLLPFLRAAYREEPQETDNTCHGGSRQDRYFGAIDGCHILKSQQ